MMVGMNDGLTKFKEGTGKKPETLHVGCRRGFNESKSFGVNGFYFDTNSVFPWFKNKRDGIEEPKIMRLLIAQKKFASYLVKEEIFKEFGTFFGQRFESIWKEFMKKMNFLPLEEYKFVKSRNINDKEYDEEHYRLCKENGLIMITFNETDFQKPDIEVLTIVGLLKKIQDLS